MSTTPTLQELLDKTIGERLAEVRVCMPGKVIAYNAERNTVDVEPQLKRPLENEDGSFEFEKFANIPDVPIKWPRGKGGTCWMTWPLAKGDFVELQFNDFDIGVWRTQGEAGNPGDLRMHGLSGATAWPGLGTNAQKFDSTKVSSDAIAIGDKVMLGAANLNEIQDGVVTGQSRDPYTGLSHYQLGNGSASIFAKKT